MRSSALVFLVLALTTPQLEADTLQKAYFAATNPGTWAKYESSWEMPDGMVGTNIYTYIRATDSADRVRIEVDTEVLEGPGEGMITRQLFIMEPSFDLARDLLDHMRFMEASVAQTGDGTPSLMPDNVIDILRQSASDLTNSVTFKGRETRAGIECDLYTYSYTSGGPHVSLHEGEICLDETVPFGLVFQKGRTTDAEGNPGSSFEQKLVDSGAGESGSDASLVMTPAEVPAISDGTTTTAVVSLPLSEAYQSEKIRLGVEIVEGSGGRLLNVTVVNKTEQPFELIVPAGPLSIPADSPLGILNIAFYEEQRFSLGPDESSPPVAAAQPGERGATEGTFNLTVYEGQPLYQGSVTVGPLN